MQSQNNLDAYDLPQAVDYNDDLDSKGPLNLNLITLNSSPEAFLIEPSRLLPIKTRLLINRRSGKIRELGPSEKVRMDVEFRKTFSALLGIVHVLKKAFLLLADDVAQVCTIDGKGIFTLSTVSFVGFENETDFFNFDKANELVGLLLNMKKILTQGFYFSFSYDLTLSKSKQLGKFPNDIRFVWNHNLYWDFRAANISQEWHLPLIQGYAGFFLQEIGRRQVKYILLSRRSQYKGGCRTYDRGLDDEGNTANFVETEQIIYINGYCCSFVQLRGNPPAFFQHYQGKVLRNVELTSPAFIKHMKDLEKNWGYILCVNLMTTGKKEELNLIDMFEGLIKHNDLSKVRYEYFDVGNAMKMNRFDKVNNFVSKIKPVIENMSFYAEQSSSKVIQLVQKGCIRTNCWDALDRTNLIQSKIAIVILDIVMRRFGVDLKTELTQDPVVELDNDNAKLQHPFLTAYRELWTDNADHLSLNYMGVFSALNANYRNTKKKTVFGLLGDKKPPATQNVGGPLDEQLRHEGITLLLGSHACNTHMYGQKIEESLAQMENMFVKLENFNIFVTSWNVNHFLPNENFDASSLFDFEGNPVPELIVIGLQEHIELSATNVVVGNDKPVDFIWEAFLVDYFRQFGRFVLVEKETLVGLLMLIFIRDDVRPRLSNLEVDTVKTGLAGTLGNKGAVVIKFNIDETSMSFTNCHMEAGIKQNHVRLMNINDFHLKPFQISNGLKRNEIGIMAIDYKFLLGDTNFRVVCENNDTRSFLERYKQLMIENNPAEAKRILDWLLKDDQLTQSRPLSDILGMYQEGKINFLPTYKYDANSYDYDTSKKARTPSWTDRILWHSATGEVHQLFYTRREYQCSDHRPVVSYFTIKTKRINKDKRAYLIRELYNQAGPVPSRYPVALN